MYIHTVYVETQRPTGKRESILHMNTHTHTQTQPQKTTTKHNHKTQPQPIHIAEPKFVPEQAEDFSIILSTNKVLTYSTQLLENPYKS